MPTAFLLSVPWGLQQQGRQRGHQHCVCGPGCVGGQSGFICGETLPRHHTWMPVWSKRCNTCHQDAYWWVVCSLMNGVFADWWCSPVGEVLTGEWGYSLVHRGAHCGRALTDYIWGNIFLFNIQSRITHLVILEMTSAQIRSN